MPARSIKDFVQPPHSGRESADAPTRNMLAALLHLASPALPVGAYSYSQGLETAIEQGIVRDAATAQSWIGDCLAHIVGRYEAPVWLRLRQTCVTRDWEGFLAWNEEFVATRETAELRAETLQMGYSLIDLLTKLGHHPPFAIEDIAFPAAHAWACECWHIDAESGLIAYLFSWIENQVMAALKAVPLGQLAGQRMLLALRQQADAVAADVAAAVVADVAQQPFDARGYPVACAGDSALSTQAPAYAIISARHESQYSRLFRS